MFFFFYNNGDPEGHMTDYSEATFEDIKHIDADGNEFWYARELMVIHQKKLLLSVRHTSLLKRDSRNSSNSMMILPKICRLRRRASNSSNVSKRN